MRCKIFHAAQHHIQVFGLPQEVPDHGGHTHILVTVDVPGDLLCIADKGKSVCPNGFLLQLELVGPVDGLNLRRIPAKSSGVLGQPFQAAR